MAAGHGGGGGVLIRQLIITYLLSPWIEGPVCVTHS
jgi:hypothetical protein